MVANFEPAGGRRVSSRLQQAFRELRTRDRPLDELLAEIEKSFAMEGESGDSLKLALQHEASQYTLPDEVIRQITARIYASAEAWQASAAAGRLPPAPVDITADSEERKAAQAEFVISGSEERSASSATNSRGESNGQRTVLNERYVLIECVGVGGSSTVFKALDRRRLLFDDPVPYVAVKILNEKLRSRSDWLDVLKQEAAKCHQLRHPNIIRVYDFLRDGDRVYITMEFLSGSPLTQVVRARGFKGMPAKDAVAIIDSMAGALAFAHERGIVHRDFKPANIFQTEDGNVKLIDFGIAQIFGAAGDESAARVKSADARDIRSQRHAVTPAYASPELLERREPDPRDDVYSLACTAYELLSGSHPFGYKSATEAKAAQLSVEPKSGITRAQLRAIKNALAFDREQRTPSVTEFMRQFNARGFDEHAVLQVATVMVFLAGLAWVYAYRQYAPPQLVGQTPAPGDEIAAADPQEQVGVGDNPLTSAMSEPALPEAQGADPALGAKTGVPTGPSSAQLSNADGGVAKGGQGPAHSDAGLTASQSTRAVVENSPNQQSQAEVAVSMPSPSVDGVGLSPNNPSERAAEENLRNPLAANRLPAVEGNPATSRREPKPGDGQTASASGDRNTNETPQRVISGDRLSLAERQLADGKLTRPRGDNASESYRLILASDPGNVRAQKGLERIGDALYKIALSKRHRGDLKGSLSLIDEGLAHHSHHRGLLSLKSVVVRALKPPTKEIPRVISGSRATRAPERLKTEPVPNSSPQPTESLADRPTSPAVIPQTTPTPRVRIFGGF